MINVSVFSESQIILHGIKNLINKIPDINVSTSCEVRFDEPTLTDPSIPHLFIVDYKLPKLDFTKLGQYECFNFDSCCGLLVLVPKNVSDDELLELLYSGANGYINENSDSDTLHRAIKKVSEGGIWVDSRILQSLLNDVPRTINISSNNLQSLEILTKREKEIVEMIFEENSNKAIAQKLYLSESTIKTHISNIYRKLGIKNRHALLSRFRLIK